MRFPIDDWQFWVATLVVLVGIVFVTRPVLRTLFPRTFAGPKQVRTALTISARRSSDDDAHAPTKP